MAFEELLECLRAACRFKRAWKRRSRNSNRVGRLMRRNGDAIYRVAVFECGSRIGRTHFELDWRFLRREWNREPVLDVALSLGSRFHSRLRGLLRCNRALSNATPLDRAN